MLSFLVWTGLAALAQTARGEYIARHDYNHGRMATVPQHSFYSTTETSPVLQINAWNASAISTSGSHIFLRQSHYAVAHSAPVVLDARDLSTVYVDHASNFEGVYGTRVQENHGRKYLTFWVGQKDDGFGTSSGYGLAYDDNYRLAYNITTNLRGRNSDLHEFAFTGHGTVLMLAVEDVQVDLAKYPEWKGSHLKLMARDNVIQEIDLETNEVLFSWRALDHISPVDTHEPSGSYWDIFHTNSIEKTEDGNYLVSMRHIHSIILINGKTGEIMWTLGGTRNTFTELAPAISSPDPIAPVLTMSWQHHARLVPGTHGRELTFFDNHAIDTSQGTCRAAGTCSRGVRVALDTSASPPTVQLLRQYLHPAGLRSKNQGSMQLLLPNSTNVFIGWGHSPAFTEHTADGAVVMDVQFAPWPDNVTPAPDNYRAYRMDWKAMPWWDPAIAVREDVHGDLGVFASWNGATEVREWVVRGGDGEGDGAVLARSLRTGFETRLAVGARAWLGKVWVEALDAKGTVLRASEVLDLSSEDVKILKEVDEIELLYPTTGEKAFASRAPWVFLGIGIVGLVGGLVYFVMSRRGGNYTYLDDDMTEVDSEMDIQDVYLDIDGLKNKMLLSPRGWDSPGMPRSPYRDLTPRTPMFPG